MSGDENGTFQGIAWGRGNWSEPPRSRAKRQNSLECSHWGLRGLREDTASRMIREPENLAGQLFAKKARGIALREALGNRVIPWAEEQLRGNV